MVERDTPVLTIKGVDIGKIRGRLQAQLTIQRITSINALQFDAHEIPVSAAEHGVEFGHQ